MGMFYTNMMLVFSEYRLKIRCYARTLWVTVSTGPDNNKVNEFLMTHSLPRGVGVIWLYLRKLRSVNVMYKFIHSLRTAPPEQEFLNDGTNLFQMVASFRDNLPILWNKSTHIRVWELAFADGFENVNPEFALFDLLFENENMHVDFVKSLRLLGEIQERDIDGWLSVAERLDAESDLCQKFKGRPHKFSGLLNTWLLRINDATYNPSMFLAAVRRLHAEVELEG